MKKPPALSSLSLTKRSEQPPDTLTTPQKTKPPPALDTLAGPSATSTTSATENEAAVKKTPLPPLAVVARRAQLGFGPRTSPMPTIEELRAAHAVRDGASTTTIVNEAYRAIDIDKDGTLSLDEVKAEVRKRCPSASEDYLDELVQVFDADGSGTIDAEEFEQLYTLVLTKHSAGPCSTTARCCGATRRCAGHCCAAIGRSTAAVAQRCHPAESREGATADRLRVLCSATRSGCALTCGLLAALIFLVLSGAHCCPNGELEVTEDHSHIPLTTAHGSDTGPPQNGCPSSVGIDSPCVVGGFNQTLHTEPNVVSWMCNHRQPCSGHVLSWLRHLFVCDGCAGHHFRDRPVELDENFQRPPRRKLWSFHRAADIVHAILAHHCGKFR
jgi:hypothetical protein